VCKTTFLRIELLPSLLSHFQRQPLAFTFALVTFLDIYFQFSQLRKKKETFARDTFKTLYDSFTRTLSLEFLYNPSINYAEMNCTNKSCFTSKSAQIYKPIFQFGKRERLDILRDHCNLKQTVFFIQIILA